MNCPKIPVHHEAKKMYKVAFQEAFFSWNEPTLKELEGHMKRSGMRQEDVVRARYYNSSQFRACVDRRVLPALLLYWRVRAVFVVYGRCVDSKTGKPLFNADAWSKADHLLKEILLGYYSDPPGISMYTKKLNPDGSVKKNKFGMEEIECCRGTNRVEAFHKNLADTFGSWHIGIGMSAVILSERRHRHNHRTSERRRPDYPKIGHYDTWLIDSLQSLVRKNHVMVLYPNWVNASDYKDTVESFDTVALHDDKLAKALDNRCDSLLVKLQTDLDTKNMRRKDKYDRENKLWKSYEIARFKLTSDQQYLCKAMGTQLPFLPFNTNKEKALFARYAGDLKHKADQQMSVWWCRHVDGVDIFPKLPVHFRTYRDKWQKNRRVLNCVRKAKSGAEKLTELNDAMRPKSTAATDVER